MQFMGKKAPSNIPNYIRNFYEQPHDAILRTKDGSTFKIHRNFLAKRSEYFRALFICEGNNQRDILIKEVSGQTLQQILHYLYEGALQLNGQNLQDIMIASDCMLLDDLIEQCREFAIRRMTTGNCLSLLIIATRHERLNIFRECSRYAKVHFEGIVENFPEKIADLPIEVLTELLKDDSLNVASEDTVGMAIYIWVKADMFGRNPHVLDLLNCIRFEEDKPPKTKRPKKVIVISNPFCINSNLFSVAHSPHYLSASSFLQRILYRETASRFPKYLNIVIKYSKSQSGQSSEIYLTCDEELDFWRKVANVPWIPDIIIPIGKYLYLFVPEDDVFLCYELLDGSLIPLTGILNRFNYCIVELHNKIYALGGITEDSDQDSDTVECYDPDSDIWNLVRSVGKMIIDNAVTMCGRIYALGHSDSLEELGDTDNLDNIEDTDSVDNIEGTDSLDDPGATGSLDDPGDTESLDDCGDTESLDDFGDTDSLDDPGDSDSLDDFEVFDNLDYLEETDNEHSLMWMRVYNPITDAWKTVESPRVFRREFSVVVFEDHLYLIGAEKNSPNLRCVEEYDPDLDVWTRLPYLPFLYLRPEARVVAGRLTVFDNCHEENYHEGMCAISPAVFWNGVTRDWKITNKSFAFYNSLDQYRFGILDDPTVVREVVSRGRRSSAQWDRILQSEMNT